VVIAKKSILTLWVACLVSTIATGADAFHDGSVAECEGCHTMHNSSPGSSGSVNPLAPFTGNRNLLLASDPSSVCLNCHQQAGDLGPTAFHVSTPESEAPAGVPPKQLTPGGDFGWLRKSYSWIPAFGQPASYSYGERHGHNIVSADYGFIADATKTAAPGGSYPALSLSCISCHDPHGRYRRNEDGSITETSKPVKGSGSYATSPDPGSDGAVGAYRLLGGVGYYPKSQSNVLAFSNPPPAAVAPEDYNRSENVSVTRVAYGSGMSQWCQNCHPFVHGDSDPTEVRRHPAGNSGEAILDANMLDDYNMYLKTGDLSGFQATSYFSLVPFEVGTSDYAVLKGIAANTPTQGPSSADGQAAVMCLTCHRAHASGWDSATRWNSKTENVVYNGNYSQQGEMYQPYGQGRTEVEAAGAYYDTPASKFALMQKSLCNKCHIRDN